MTLQDKVAVLVGGEGPLGRAVTNKFLKEGAKLVIGWYSPEEWAQAKELIATEYLGRVRDMQIDATKEAQIEALISKAMSEFGGVDVLLHMVGQFYAGPLLRDTAVEVWDRLIAINLTSAFLSSKHAVKAMLARGKGRIVFFPAAVAFNPEPGFGAYAVSKSGVVTLAQALRQELKDTAITVNCVVPTVMDTWRTRRMPNAEPDKWVTPAEVAELLAAVCSDSCSALNASVLRVPGRL